MANSEKCSPHGYKPAREMAPAGTRNTSRKESGGRLNPPGDVKSTPSMDTSRRGNKDEGGVWQGPTGTTAGTPPSD